MEIMSFSRQPGVMEAESVSLYFVNTSAWMWLAAGKELGGLSGKECSLVLEEGALQLEAQAMKELMDSRLRKCCAC